MPFTKEVRVGKIVFRVDPDLPRGTFTIGSYMSNNLNDILQQKGLSVNVRGEDFEGKVDRVVSSLTEQEARVLLREHGYWGINHDRNVLQKILTPDYTKISRHVREQFLKRMRLDQALEILRNADMTPPRKYTLEDLRNIIISNNLPIDMRKMKLMDRVPKKPKVDNKGRFLLESKARPIPKKRHSLSPSKPSQIQRRHSASRLPSYDIQIATTKPSMRTRYLMEERPRREAVSKRHSLSPEKTRTSLGRKPSSISRLPSYDIQIATTKPSGRSRYLMEESLRNETVSKRHSLSPTKKRASSKKRPSSVSRLPSYDVPPIATTKPSGRSRYLMEESLRKNSNPKRMSLSPTKKRASSKKRPSSVSRLPSYDVPQSRKSVKTPETDDSLIPEWFFELPIVSDIFPPKKKKVKVVRYRKHLIPAKYHEMYEHNDKSCSFCEHYLRNYHPIIYKRLQNQ